MNLPHFCATTDADPTHRCEQRIKNGRHRVMSPCTTFFAKPVRYDLQTVEVLVYDVMVLDGWPFRILCDRTHVFYFQVREEMNPGLDVGCWLSRLPDDVGCRALMNSPPIMSIVDHHNQLDVE